MLSTGVLAMLPELLASWDTQVRRWACTMLGNLACYEFTATAILAENPCAHLVALLRSVSILSSPRK